MRRGTVLRGTALATIASLTLCVAASPGSYRRGLHYAPNGNFDHSGSFLPASFGFNVADVADASRLDALHAGVQALVWIGQCDGVTSGFLAAVRPFLGDRRVLGFFLMDDPDPRPAPPADPPYPPCRAENLKQESDWLHEHMPGTTTVIALMNLGTASDPYYGNYYLPENTHVDLFGIAAYPCRTEWSGCDYGLIDRHVSAAELAGIPLARMMPVYQAFGGGLWKDDNGGTYVLPTADEEIQILRRWRTLVRAPLLDMAYSWGSQKNDKGLENTPELQKIFSFHNQSRQQP